MSTPSFIPTPVDSRKRADQVREGITAMIRAGQLQNGDKLPTETQLANYAERNGLSVRQALAHVDDLGFGPKITSSIKRLGELLDEFSAIIETEPVDLLLVAAIARQLAEPAHIRAVQAMQQGGCLR